MLQTTTMAMIAGGAVALLLIIVALGRYRRARRRAEYTDLPALLYLAGNNATGRPDAAAARPIGSIPGWRGAQPRREAKATAWGPAPDETVQLLPGSLRPESGDEEIRFAARAGCRRFTLGRGRGAAHDHIQLSAPTVSRMHAWMEFRDGEWRIGRLSRTNDVVVNGTSIGPDSAHPLRDGDRLELGEVAFAFHHPGQRVRVTDADA